MIFKDLKKDLFTIPNWLSLFRLLLIPVYVVIYLQAEHIHDYAIAAGILTVSCLTDLIDGKIARHFNMVSTLGKILDPLADKATQAALLICLALRHPILWLLVGIMVVKEGFQLLAGILALRRGKILTGALYTGKICTTVLFISLIFMVLMPNLKPLHVNLLTAVDAAFLLVAFAHYVYVYHFRTSNIQDLEQEQ